ncbi:MAG TPA: amidohydrolase [Anaerolineae bacterium]|nr:amidohydrolase [Anaerolineae bacterium]
MKIIIRGGTIIPVTEPGRVLENADLYIDDGRIAAISPDEPPFPLSAAERVIDAEGCVVLPGLVNAHGHLALALYRGLGEWMPGTTWVGIQERQGALARNLEPQAYYDGARLLIAEMIRAGITTFADINFEPPGAPPVTDLIAQAVEATGIRACLTLETNGYIARAGARLHFDENEAKRTFQMSKEFCQHWHGRASGRITTMLGIANPPVPRRVILEWVARAADEMGFAIQLHVAEIAQEIREWQEFYGKSAAEMMAETGILNAHVLGGNCVFFTAQDAQILRDYDFHASTCPQNCCKLCLGMLDVPMLLEAGVNVALGTNEVINNNNLDMIEEMRFAALYHKMARRDPRILGGDIPLRLITIQGGKALNLAVGCLETGRPADVIVMDARGPHWYPRHDMVANVIYSSAAADVRTVIIDGRIVMEDRRIRTFDEAEVIARVETRLAALRAELPAPRGVEDSAMPPEVKWTVEA